MMIQNRMFGIRLNRVRLRVCPGMDRKDVAKELGVSAERIAQWEENGNVPDGDMLKKLSEFYDVSVDYLLGGEDSDEQNFVSAENPVLDEIAYTLAKLGSKDLEKVRKLTVKGDILAYIFLKKWWKSNEYRVMY